METMDINVMRCKVCNHTLNISKENVYVAKVENVFFHTSDVRIVDVRIYCRKGLKKRLNSL